MTRPGFHPFTLHQLGDPDQLDANDDYSEAGGVTRFVKAPPAGEAWDLLRLAGAIHDDDSDYNKYGALDALSEGVRIVIEDADGNELVDLTAGIAVTKTEDWFRAGFTIAPLGSGAGDTRGTQVLRTFASAPVVRGNQGERLAVLIPAVNLSTLEYHAWVADVNVRHVTH